MSVIFRIVLLFLYFYFSFASQRTLMDTSGNVLPKNAPKSRLQKLAGLTSWELILEDLEKILIVRVPDTPNHKLVQDYIVAQFMWSDWKVEKDNFEHTTPFGNKEFTNILATYNSDAQHFLVLGAHYDSKYFKEFKFVGAVDSAVPCAILLDVARTLGPDLKKLSGNWGVKIIFFDGEEALNPNWTKEDSLYGSRHLAQKMKETVNEDGGQSELEKINLFVLLDLVGAKSIFYSLNETTRIYFNHLISIETRLRKLELLKTTYNIFSSQAISVQIDDDHLPFQESGVTNILHLIPVGFPPQWHKVSDDFPNLDISTVQDWATIIRVFVSECLNL